MAKKYLSKGEVLEAWEVKTRKATATISVKGQFARIRKMLVPLVGKTVRVYIEVVE
jgi:hypothetical protein